ncbi:hypothetical protein AHAS_Ahas17G0135200 [Arachis hypogaea]
MEKWISRRWTRKEEIEVQKVVVWVKIPNFLVKLYNKYFLRNVGKTIVTKLRVDELTFIHFREKFAHICVEVDLRKKLVPSFSALGKEFRLEYGGLHQICFHCGRYEHKVDGCPKMLSDAMEMCCQRWLWVAKTTKREVGDC